jgi:hypothetical protein
MNEHISTPTTESSGWWLRFATRFSIPLCCAGVCLALIVPWIARAAGARGGFDGVVRSLESQYHVRATRIPLMGLASLITGAATHGGVGGIQIAEFEHFSEPVDGEELNRMVEEKLGQGWDRMIRETNRNDNEQTLIFARPDGNRMELFVLDLDGHELDVVQVSVDPDHLNESIGKYKHHKHDSGDETD